MATETSKTSTTAEPDEAAEDATARDADARDTEARDAAPQDTAAQDAHDADDAQAAGPHAYGDQHDPDARHDDTDLHEAGPDEVTAPRRGGFGAGAAAVVSAGLGLGSLTGTPLSEMLRDRQQLIGQIESSSPAGGGGGAGDQVNALYGAPWHATALVNGVFALLAVVVGGVLLAAVARRAETRSWVRSVALGGLVLGVIGLVVAAGMYFDLFASAPQVPGAPS